MRVTAFHRKQNRIFFLCVFINMIIYIKDLLLFVLHTQNFISYYRCDQI